MATHSSVLAWRIRQNLVGCRLWGRTELDTAEATWQQYKEMLLSPLLSLSSFVLV